MSENDQRLAELLKGKVDEVKARLAGLPAPDLQRMEELETAGENRKGVLEAIDAVLAALVEANGGDLDDVAALRGAVDKLMAENERLEAENVRLVTESQQLKSRLADAEEAFPEDVVKLREENARLNAELEANQGGKSEPKGGKKARGEELPDWKKPDYNGPLTGDQAMWRNRNISRK